MLSYRQLAILLAFSCCLAGASCRGTQASARLDSRALLQIAREYRPSKHANQVLAAAPLTERRKASAEALQTEQEYEGPIKQYFRQGNFDQLEKAASEARDGRAGLLAAYGKYLISMTLLTRLLSENIRMNPIGRCIWTR